MALVIHIEYDNSVVVKRCNPTLKRFYEDEINELNLHLPLKKKWLKNFEDKKKSIPEPNLVSTIKRIQAIVQEPIQEPIPELKYI